MTDWKTISGQEGRYAVSDDGNVMSMDFAGSGLPGILKTNLARGYATVQLRDRKRFTVHRLVAAAFIGPRPTGMAINHVNGCKTDNRSANLEYVTPSENMKHAFATGLQSNVGENHSGAKLTNDKVERIKAMLVLGFTQSEIASMMGVTQPSISLVKNGRRWAHLSEGELS